jgi:predicted RNA-binding Zn-ribbon protein involved in translation (DUF1610 family)
MKKCKNCGYEIKDGYMWNVCPECSEVINNEKEISRSDTIGTESANADFTPPLETPSEDYNHKIDYSIFAVRGMNPENIYVSVFIWSLLLRTITGISAFYFLSLAAMTARAVRYQQSRTITILFWSFPVGTTATVIAVFIHLVVYLGVMYACETFNTFLRGRW